MNPIYIHFESFSPNINSKTYIQHALKGLSDYYVKLGGEEFMIDFKKHDNLAQDICDKMTVGEIPITNSNDFPEIEEFYRKRIDIMISCAKGIIDEVAPLMSEEDDLSFKESYLCEDWKEFSKGCGVITRKSNYATVNFLFPDTTISDEGALNKDFSNFPGAQKAMKRSTSDQEQDTAKQELLNSFVL